MLYFILSITQAISHFTTEIPQLLALTDEQILHHNDDKKTRYTIDEMCEHLPRSVAAIQIASNLYYAENCFTENYATPAFEPVDGLLHYPSGTKAAYISESVANALIGAGVNLNTLSHSTRQSDLDLNVYHYLSSSDVELEGAGALLRADAPLLWAMLGNIPVDEDGHIDEPFLSFEPGTDRESIWTWFESVFDLSVHSLMFPKTEKNVEPPAPTRFPISQGRIFFSNDEAYLSGVKAGAEYANDGALDIGLVEQSVLPQYAFMLSIGDSDDDTLFGDFDGGALVAMATPCSVILNR